MFSASDNVLAYQTGSSISGFQLVWFDRAGKQVGVASERAGQYEDLNLSPDGKRAVVLSFDPQYARGSVEIVDLERRLHTRFAVDQTEIQAPAWSSDGSRIVFGARHGSKYALYQKAADGSGAEEILFEDDKALFPIESSRDGRYLLYGAGGVPPSAVLGILPLFGDRKPSSYLSGPFTGPGQFSPDGRWIVYFSFGSQGRSEVYVAPISDSGQRVRISTTGGTMPRWRGDGKELFYVSTDGKLMAVSVDGSGPSFKVGAVQPLFNVRPRGARYTYDVTADGQRFLVSTQPDEGQQKTTPITVVVNWTANLLK